MRTLLLLIVIATCGCSKEPECMTCTKGSETIVMCDGEHSREVYLYTSQGYVCR